MARSTPRTVKDAATINKNWLAAMASTTTQNKYKDGISRYNGNPMQAAASQEAMDKYVNKVQQSVSTGKRAKALNDADPNMWKQNALQVGATALGTGAQKKAAKQLKRAQAWQSVYQQASNAAAAVPDDGGANLGKVQAALNVLIAAKGKV